MQAQSSQKRIKIRIEDGELGELLYLKAVRMQGRLIGWDKRKQETPIKQNLILMYQIKNFHGFLWLKRWSLQ